MIEPHSQPTSNGQKVMIFLEEAGLAWQHVDERTSGMWPAACRGSPAGASHGGPLRNTIGDKPVRLRCGVADFAVTKGLMQVSTLVVDTDVSTITGQGHINLADETLDLTLVPKTRATSLIALRTPIYLRGTFSHPLVDLDRGRVLARSGLALGMAVLNPLLALIPLVEMGPGLSSDCERLIREAQAPQLRKP